MPIADTDQETVHLNRFTDLIGPLAGHSDSATPSRSARRTLFDTSHLARVKFDVPGQRPQRFRLVYRQLDEATREILAIGPRDQHAIYRLAARRLTP